jgi:hypothetical protein
MPNQIAAMETDAIFYPVSAIAVGRRRRVRAPSDTATSEGSRAAAWIFAAFAFRASMEHGFAGRLPGLNKSLLKLI